MIGTKKVKLIGRKCLYLYIYILKKATENTFFGQSKRLRWERVPGISGNSVGKSKLPPRNGCSLEAVEPHP